LDYYIGTPRQRTERKSIEVLGTPADRWNPNSAQDGAFNWDRIDTTGAIYAAAIGQIAEPWKWVVEEENLLPGGGGVASLRPEQELNYSDTYFVTASKDAYIKFVMSYCFDRCQTNDDFYSRTDWISIAEIEEESASESDRTGANQKHSSQPSGASQ